MQFTAEKKDLIRAMKHVCRAVERRATLPILSHTRIVADVESATFDGEWEVGVNCSYIAEIVSSIKSDRVSISFVEAGKPLLIQGVGESEDLTILMPMRV